ncbi:DUF1349 domain-containing protein [Tuanshanicoccus lijuaniae]|uniref:DUF1349 domain-containing protein n=1 Tax=Aerococcaceae bacterium zg-1292 TaxID=2774330 RepID=UPI001BD8AA4D|nr:DUF1349 domain-containing protein [Aerococcaceae bacterium zg-A91]MBS4457840.1 DUF1349 domain-containing protein [Aerococcaceae bacterium zg-BR33]
MNFDITQLQWINEPTTYTIAPDKLSITTEPYTDLWQRTYYHFRNDNAPVLQLPTDEAYFTFTVKVDFNGSKQRFDQAGVVVYLDSEHWLKASVEYENDAFQHLGSVVTNHGYSDWATMEIPATVKDIWFRLSRRQDDFKLEFSTDGVRFEQMRIAHLFTVKEQISFGVYACSPEDSSFTAHFTQMNIGECLWQAHDGQQPD